MTSESGYRYSGNVLYRTTDNGQTWQAAQATGYSYSITPAGTILKDFVVLDAQTAWVLTADATTGAHVLQRTTTGPTGLSSTGLSLPAAANFKGLHFFDATTGIALAVPPAGGSSWVVYRTTDGGATWTTVTTAMPLSQANSSYSSSYITKAVFGSSLWLGTEDGDILRTADKGLTWSKAPSNLGAQAMGIAFRDAQHGLAHRKTKQLVRTTDGGLTWQPVATTWSENIASLIVQPGTNIYLGASSKENTSALTISGLLTTSTDDGTSWQTRLTDDVPYAELAMSSGGQLWAANLKPFRGYPFYLPPPTYGMLLRYVGTSLASQATAAGRQTAAYPNPTAGLVQLPLAPGETVRVYDALGRLHTCPATVSTLDLLNEPAGMYFVTVTAATGAAYTQRLVVVH